MRKDNPVRTARRGQPFTLFVSTVIALLAASSPLSVPAVAEWHHNQIINAPDYLSSRGKWDIINLPEAFRLNTIHAALLPTGKVLLVAGSGNNRDSFNEFNNNDMISVLKTAVLDPTTMEVKIIPTPSDLFCSGHALLQSGKVLVAGGTSGYELLEGDVKKPAGAMIIHNENPDGKARSFNKGTRFTGPDGKVYVSTQDIVVQPATKMEHDDGSIMITHSSVTVFVEAVAEDTSYITTSNEHYDIVGLKGDDVHNIYGQGGPMTLNKQDYRGDNRAYEFDPVKEAYVRVGDMKESRWYPTLPVMTNGDVLAVSGLDNTGQITDTTERYDPATKAWSWGPDQAFPTYPALFRTQDPDVLFFSGSSAGYGPADKGRVPGFWNVKTNSFRTVTGLRDTNIAETSASVVLPPTAGSNDASQSSRIMILGGGGVGESPLVTARTDVIDLASDNPSYKAGPGLPAAVRYPNVSVTPWDELFISGGSSDYRGKENSYNYKAAMLNPTTNQMEMMADSLVGRSYHSGSLLLPDSRILVFGNDPLYSDKDNTQPGKFEQRMEIYTPPQLYRGARPTLNGNNDTQAHRGQTLTFTSTDAGSIKTARLIAPSTTTHVTNIEQRSLGAIVKHDGNTVTIELPTDENVMSNGWYMLFVTNTNGTPSVAKMIQVTP